MCSLHTGLCTPHTTHCAGAVCALHRAFLHTHTVRSDNEFYTSAHCTTPFAHCVRTVPSALTLCEMHAAQYARGIINSKRGLHTAHCAHDVLHAAGAVHVPCTLHCTSHFVLCRHYASRLYSLQCTADAVEPPPHFLGLSWGRETGSDLVAEHWRKITRRQPHGLMQIRGYASQAKDVDA